MKFRIKYSLDTDSSKNTLYVATAYKRYGIFALHSYYSWGGFIDARRCMVKWLRNWQAKRDHARVTKFERYRIQIPPTEVVEI